MPELTERVARHDGILRSSDSLVRNSCKHRVRELHYGYGSGKAILTTLRRQHFTKIQQKDKME